MAKIRVRRYDGPLRYIATSEEEGERKNYLVDLGEWSCDCRHFQCRLGQKIKAGAPRGKYSCKHIREVVIKFAYNWIDTIIELEKEQAKMAKKNPFVIGKNRVE